MRRISAALSAVVGTIVNVVTLPFRVLGKLVTPSRGRPARSAGRRAA
ncbi:LPFR motif small protein [Actinomadura fibrosa]|uniref:LPFR motif small protein n=1 Tax=Actinomadura fibrosa TaxID=111802 RepID=A0ABW2XRZ7_9ACTN|nr:LPFR motif small protein [Actinomadura fibrosa]